MSAPAIRPAPPPRETFDEAMARLKLSFHSPFVDPEWVDEHPDELPAMAPHRFLAGGA